MTVSLGRVEPPVPGRGSGAGPGGGAATTESSMPDDKQPRQSDKPEGSRRAVERDLARQGGTGEGPGDSGDPGEAGRPETRRDDAARR